MPLAVPLQIYCLEISLKLPEVVNCALSGQRRTRLYRDLTLTLRLRRALIFRDPDLSQMSWKEAKACFLGTYSTYTATMRQKRVTFDIRLLPKLALWATLIFFFAALKPQDQVSALQLLVYLMPPCHSDTLERLLKALHKITENCEDSIGADGQLVKICWKG